MATRPVRKRAAPCRDQERLVRHFQDVTTLPRTLGLLDLIWLTIGSVIGSGIFLVPGAVLRQVNGFIVPALLVWLVGGVLSLLGALTYGELAALKPAARSEEHTSELQSHSDLVCRLLLEKKKQKRHD